MNERQFLESFDGFLPPPAEDCLPEPPEQSSDAFAESPDDSVCDITDEAFANEAPDASEQNCEEPDFEESETDEDEQDDGLTEEEADLVNRLADWLVEVRVAAEEEAALAEAHADLDVDRVVIDGDEDATSPGLFRLVEEFTALRQDVKLQAKSARGLQDQTESLLAGLNRSIEQFQSVTPREQQAARDALKPLLESVIDLDASLDRGRVAAEMARARWMGESTDGWKMLMDTEIQALPAWKRWLLQAISGNLIKSLHAGFVQSWSATQDAQVEGYRLIQNRLRRLLQQYDVEQIETIGRPTDPNLMTVIDVADHDSLPAGTVMEELRPGYLWRGQLLRYAEVRVVRSRGEAQWALHE